MPSIEWHGWNGTVETRSELVRTEAAGVVLSLQVSTGDKVRISADVVVVKDQNTLTIMAAPFDGVVEQTFVKEGDTITKGQAVARIVASKAKDAVADVGADEARRLAIGGMADVSLNGKLYEGWISEIGAIAPGRSSAQIKVHVSGELAHVKPGARVAISFR
jgi:multidrug resistance efflux pump